MEMGSSDLPACSGWCLYLVGGAGQPTRDAHLPLNPPCRREGSAPSVDQPISLHHVREVEVMLLSLLSMCRFEEELRTLLEEDAPERVLHSLQLTQPRTSPCPPSTACKSHAPLTTPLPMRKSLGDQVDWVVQELTALK